jgi:predicted hydrolase (HD superfamily)
MKIFGGTCGLSAGRCAATQTELGEDPDHWQAIGLLHDFDWEIHPDLDRHPGDGAPLLRERGVDEATIRTILSHNTEGTGVEREKPIDFALSPATRLPDSSPQSPSCGPRATCATSS